MDIIILYPRSEKENQVHYKDEKKERGKGERA